jgi:Flp pilus assembly protein TadB
MSQVVALVFAAVALWLFPSGACARRSRRVDSAPLGGERYRLAVLAGLAAAGVLTLLVGFVSACVTGVVVGAGVEWFLRRRGARPDPVNPLQLAASWDLFAACLGGGLTVPQAIGVVGPELPAEPAKALRGTAELLTLGATPERAWRTAMTVPATAELARAAVRSARSGAELAEVSMTLARRARRTAEDDAAARAQRAGVLVTGPLGLCFLPAFLCLGVVPVVAGLASKLLGNW